MIKYLIETKMNGVKIDLIESQYGYAVIYGMERRTYTLADKALAYKSYKDCINHAIDCE